MSTQMPGVQSFSAFLHYFELLIGLKVSSDHSVMIYHSPYVPLRGICKWPCMRMEYTERPSQFRIH